MTAQENKLDELVIMDAIRKVKNNKIGVTLCNY